MNTIPTPASRDRNADLLALSRKLITERLSFDREDFNPRIAEGGDLLTDFVTSALGAEYRVQWGALSDGEVADVCSQAKAWGDYCLDLFESVHAFVLSRLV